MFKRLRPDKVYVTEDVYEDPRAAACVDRLMGAIDEARPERVSYETLDRIAPERWANVGRWGAISSPRDPDLVMTTAKFLSDDAKEQFRSRYPNLHIRDIWGFNTSHLRRDGDVDEQLKRGCICQTAWELHSATGCPFRCAYCGLGGVNRIFVNMEEYTEHLDEVCARAPAQRLYKWDNVTDVTCFEPEWGASRLLVEYFARKDGKYLEIYAGKSDNIDNLLGLDHRGKTIIQWSVSGRTQSTVLEKETAPWDRRVDAAARCQKAGYMVRFRFSPIIPVKGWEDENAALIERIFEKTKPDVISLCAFGWMDVEVARACIDFSLLDPTYVAVMESAAPFLKSRGFTRGGGTPIPHDARAHMFKFLIDEIRKRNATIPISLCLETPEMWALFGKELGMGADIDKRNAYFCNCGPTCTPGHTCREGVTPGRSLFVRTTE